MSLTFKSVKINFKLTEETLNFYATMYWNHVRVGTVKNYGTGGAHIYDWKQSPQTTEAKDWLIHHPDTFRLKSCDVVDYDHVITHLIVQHQRNKQLKLWCKTQTVFRCTDTPNHSWIKLNIQYTKEMDALLAKKYPNLVEIANHRFA